MRIRIQNTAGIGNIFSLLKELVLTMFLFLFHVFGGHGLHVTPIPPPLPLAAGVLACTHTHTKP
jgi:hypothetical protein